MMDRIAAKMLRVSFLSLGVPSSPTCPELCRGIAGEDTGEGKLIDMGGSIQRLFVGTVDVDFPWHRPPCL